MPATSWGVNQLLSFAETPQPAQRGGTPCVETRGGAEGPGGLRRSGPCRALLFWARAARGCFVYVFIYLCPAFATSRACQERGAASHLGGSRGELQRLCPSVCLSVRTPTSAKGRGEAGDGESTAGAPGGCWWGCFYPEAAPRGKQSPEMRLLESPQPLCLAPPELSSSSCCGV